MIYTGQFHIKGSLHEESQDWIYSIHIGNDVMKVLKSI
jgi:hypothetical protein